MTTLVDTRLGALARIGRALADPTRCRLLLALLDGPAYPSELATKLGLTRANTSNHLACLRGCGIVLAEPKGRQVRYTLLDANLAHALGDLADVVLADGGGARVLDALGACLGGHFEVEHCTFQLEPEAHLNHEQGLHR